MEQAREVGEKLKEGVAHLKDEAHEYAERARSGARVLRGRAGDVGRHASELIDDTALFIDENPQKSTMIAAMGGLVIGILLGLLIRRGGD